MKKGKLPITQEIVLESTPAEWAILRNQLIEHLDCTGTVQRTPDSRVRIRLRLVGIFSPSDCRQTCIAEHDNADKQIRRGLERMDEFFVNLYKEKQWLMFGVILGERPKPIMIMHIDKFNISIYTTSFAREELGYMLPEGVHIE